MWDEKTVLQMASLAKLHVSEDEAKVIGAQMQKVFEYFQIINAHDLKAIAPLITPVPIAPHFREDQKTDKTDPEEFLQNAPERQGSLLRVPPVLS